MTRTKGDYLWAPKESGVVTGLLDTLGFSVVGDSSRYPAGIKSDVLVAITEAINSNDVFASMVGTRTRELQENRRPDAKSTSETDVLKFLQQNNYSESDLKALMSRAGIK